MIDIGQQNPEKIIVAGDWHRHWGAAFAKKVVKYAGENGIHHIVQVGDFGFRLGPRGDDASRFEKPLQLALKEYGVHIVWIDGNHDNHQWLREQTPLDNGFIKTGASGHLFYAPRGHRWLWSGKRFGALGGAWSINWAVLKEGSSLFRDLEETRQEDVDRLGDGPLDYLITHDVPKSVAHLFEGKKVFPETSRPLIQQAVDRTLPGRVFSGHWHVRKDFDIPRADGNISKGHVLNKEVTASNFIVLDLTADKLIWPEGF